MEIGGYQQRPPGSKRKRAPGAGSGNQRVGLGFAADDAKTLPPQQQEMSDCSAQAKEKALKGDERKSFTSECLKAEKPATTSQQKMKDCNKQATGKTGDDRKAFMKQCLSGSPS